MTKKNPAAVALGRLGGKARVPKGFAKFGPERLAEASRKSVEAKRKKRQRMRNTSNQQERR